MVGRDLQSLPERAERAPPESFRLRRFSLEEQHVGILREPLRSAVQDYPCLANRLRLRHAQKQLRRLMPPLNELLTPDQTRIARNGAPAEKVALLNSFEPEKRQQILRALGPGPLTELPDLRREAMAANQPQQVVNSDLIENKLYRAMASAALSPARFYHLPTNRVVELGTQIAI